MKLSELIQALQAIKNRDGDIVVQFLEDLTPLTGIKSKVPALYTVTNFFYPRINPDGSFTLPGREELVRLLSESLNESFHGSDGNILTMIGGYTAAPPITYVPNPNPVPVETGPWWSKLKLWKGGAKDGSYVLSLAPNLTIPLYNRAGGTVVSQRKVDYDMKVWDVIPDPRTLTLGWIKVSESPEFWVQSTAVKPKS